MRLSGQFQACLFLLRKHFECTKTQINAKPTNKTKLSEQKTTKATIFWPQKLLRGGKFSFLKKIEIVFVTSFTILLTGTFATDMVLLNCGGTIVSKLEKGINNNNNCVGTKQIAIANVGQQHLTDRGMIRAKKNQEVELEKNQQCLPSNNISNKETSTVYNC